MLCYVEKEVESGAVGCPRVEAEVALVLWGHRLQRDKIPEPSGQGRVQAGLHASVKHPAQNRACCEEKDRAVVSGWYRMQW